MSAQPTLAGLERPCPVKLVSLWGPWSRLVVEGLKTVETRSWSTTFEGVLLIHETRNRIPWARDWPEVARQLKVAGLPVPAIDDTPRPGCLIGAVDLRGCVSLDSYDVDVGRLGGWSYQCGRLEIGAREEFFGTYGVGRFGLLLANAVSFAHPIEIERGSQGRPIDVPVAALPRALAELEEARHGG